MRGVIFRSALRYLKFKPADGLSVVARGRISVYEPKGEYQLVCEHLEPQGLGRAAARVRSAEEAATGRRAVRPGPQAAAACPAPQDRDRHLARRRRDPRHHQSAPAALRERAPGDPSGRVQGEDAAPDIARGLRAIGRVPGVDVVIVGRGGGSIEDLWAFNEEVVARAIARVAGSGHFGGRPRKRRDDCRLRRRPSGADAVGGGRDGRRRQGRVLQPDRSAARSARRRRAGARAGAEPAGARDRRPAGVRRLSRPCRDARPACRRSHAYRRARSMRAGLAARERRLQQLQRQLGLVRSRPAAGRHPNPAGVGGRTTDGTR